MNEVILITGGTGKVGSHLVAHFLKNSWIVLSTTRNKENFNEVVEKHSLEAHEDNFFIIELDFKNDNAIQDLEEYLVEHNLRPNVVVHNARSLEYSKINARGRAEVEDLQMEYYMAVTFPYLLTYSLVDLGELKNVVYISSMYGVVAPTPKLYEDFESSSPVQYGVAKAAQIHLVKELAIRLAKNNIRVNCVSFGGIKGRTSEEFKKRYQELTPLGKMLEETEVVGPVDFLVSEKSKNMTGQNIIVDGGWTVW